MSALADPLSVSPEAAASHHELKAVIFEEVKPLYSKTDAGYEGFGVDVLEQIRMQSGRRRVSYRMASTVKDRINAVITGKADLACGVAFTWGRSTQLNYRLPFGVGGTRLLTASDISIDGTPDSLKGQTIGVVRDTASTQVLKSVVPGATLKSLDTPAEALKAYNCGDVPILAKGPSGSPPTAALRQPPCCRSAPRDVRASAASSARTTASFCHGQSRHRWNDAGLHGW